MGVRRGGPNKMEMVVDRGALFGEGAGKAVVWRGGGKMTVWRIRWYLARGRKTCFVRGSANEGPCACMLWDCFTIADQNSILHALTLLI